MAAPAMPETPTQARCRQAVEKMRRAVAATGQLRLPESPSMLFDQWNDAACFLAR